MKRIDRRYFFDILESTSNRQALVSTVYNYVNTCLAKAADSIRRYQRAGQNIGDAQNT